MPAFHIYFSLKIFGFDFDFGLRFFVFFTFFFFFCASVYFVAILPLIVTFRMQGKKNEERERRENQPQLPFSTVLELLIMSLSPQLHAYTFLNDTYFHSEFIFYS